MALEHLKKTEQDLVLCCLGAVVQGPFFNDSQFHAMFGLGRAEVASILTCWRTLPETELDVFIGINNAMNNLLIWWGWQDEDPEEGTHILRLWVGAPADEIQCVYLRWLAGRRGGIA